MSRAPPSCEHRYKTSAAARLKILLSPELPFLSVPTMPLIPPMSIGRSVSGLSGKERHTGNSLLTAAPAKANVKREGKDGMVKEQLTSNVKQLAKKSQPRTFIPAAKEASAEVHAKRRGRLLEGFPASNSGESLSKPEKPKKSSTLEKTRDGREEQVRFTLTLTPEAVLLLQRRNSERRQRSASRNGGATSGGASDARRRKDNTSKRHHAATPRQPGNPNSRTSAGLGDISSFVKISLLNERHKYDDVEYEEEQDCGVDERVVLKCTEWLRGLENTPVTVGNGPQAV